MTLARALIYIVLGIGLVWFNQQVKKTSPHDHCGTECAWEDE